MAEHAFPIVGEYTGEQVKSADIANTQQVSTDKIAGKYKLLTHNYKLDHTKKVATSPVDIELKSDGTVTGAATGTWTVENGTSYITIKLGTTTYQGVMVEQTLEPSDTKVPAFTALAASTGVTIWGYQTEVSTGMHEVEANKGQCADAIYDLCGRRVSTLQRKGFYIRNGNLLLLNPVQTERHGM